MHLTYRIKKSELHRFLRFTWKNSCVFVHIAESPVNHPPALLQRGQKLGFILINEIHDLQRKNANVLQINN